MRFSKESTKKDVLPKKNQQRVMSYLAHRRLVCTEITCYLNRMLTEVVDKDRCCSSLLR